MKRLISWTIAFTLGIFSFFPLMADIDYSVDVFAFRDAKGNPYLEIHTNIDASTIMYTQLPNGKFQGEVDVLLFLQEDGSEAEANALRVNLKSPVLDDTNSASLEQLLIDVRKIAAKEGKYSLTGFLTDNADPAKKEHRFEREVRVAPPRDNGLAFSNVLFLDKFEKTKEKKPYSRYGYDAMTRIADNYYENKDSLLFYLEVYNVPGMEEKAPYFLHTYITQANSAEKLKKYQRTIKKVAAGLDLYSTQFDISQLPSQTYFLNLELYNQTNELIGITSRKFFVINDKLSVDFTSSPDQFERSFALNEGQLDEIIPTLSYISTATEIDFGKNLATYDEKKNYFISFWEKRRDNEIDNPAKPWLAYKAKLDYVNEKFRAFNLPGWKTARGRVLLTYGPPNDIEYFPAEQWKYPHEIWRYNKLRVQTNVMFVFWDMDRITEEYPLLHSNLRGEVNNPRWKLDLLRRTTMDGNIDNIDEFGNKDQRYGNDPLGNGRLDN